MLKNYGIIKDIGFQVAAAAEEAAQSVINDYTSLKGREEEITGQLRGEINRRLLKNVEERLDGRTVKGCKFSVATFKKLQENGVGADLAGVVDITVGGRAISKAFLAQAKVGESYAGPRGAVHIKGYNADIMRQAEDMLSITSDSFFFMYSDKGIHCVSALQVFLAGKNSIDTGNHPFHTFGSFYEEFFKCFIGDHSISPSALGASDLEDYAEKIKAKAVLRLSVQLPSS